MSFSEQNRTLQHVRVCGLKEQPGSNNQAWVGTPPGREKKSIRRVMKQHGKLAQSVSCYSLLIVQMPWVLLVISSEFGMRWLKSQSAKISKSADPNATKVIKQETYLITHGWTSSFLFVSQLSGILMVSPLFFLTCALPHVPQKASNSKRQHQVSINSLFLVLTFSGLQYFFYLAFFFPFHFPQFWFHPPQEVRWE